MEHLSMDEIISFISFNEMTESNLTLASRVNMHMIECPICRKKIVSIQNTLERILVFSGAHSVDLSDMTLDDEIQSEITAFYGNAQPI